MGKLFKTTLFLSTFVFSVATWASGDKGSCEGVAVADYSRSAAYKVQALMFPQNVLELQHLVRSTNRPIAVKGAGFSMGGQTAARNGVVVEMKNLNQISEFDAATKTIRVGAGATWRQIQQFIDPHNLSVMIMQSYNNFQVGGSLSVNAHGRYIGYGPLISSVLDITVMLADGSIVKASRQERPELFSGLIGGYAALGIILDAKLQLVDNVKLERKTKVFKNADIGAAVQDFIKHFDAAIGNNSKAQLANADIYPPDYDTVRSVVFEESDKELTIAQRMQTEAPTGFAALKDAAWMSAEQFFPWVKRWRARSHAPRTMDGEQVVWRNWEASYDNAELKPLNDRVPFLRALPMSDRKALLQEYFIPKAKLPEFISKLTEIYRRRGVNVSNISLRHVPANNESMLSWSKEECFAVVVYYTQPYGKSKRAKNLAHAQEWTREVIAQVERLGGSFYLPYQVYATRDQFNRAYPRSQEFFDLKRRFDPTGKFNNSLWEQYNLSADTYFYRDLLANEEGRDELRLYFKNIFSINDPERFIAAIDTAIEETKKQGRDINDRNIYEVLLKILPQFANGPLKAFAKTIKALRVQQAEMANETAAALKAVGVTSVNGYVEIGSPGRYVRPLKDLIDIRGRVTAVNDVFGIPAMVESSWGFGVPASLRSKKIKLKNHDMMTQIEVPNESVDLVSMFIGLHHCPPHKLEAFVSSIYRMLRPGGHFVLRDHDADDRLLSMAFMAHSTYNAGLGIPYGEELGEIRNLHPLGYWKALLAKAGLEFVGTEYKQEGDPTGNTLMVFKKVERNDAKQASLLASIAAAPTLEGDLNLLPGYHRDQSNTYMTQAEWFLVDIFYELSDFMRNHPWFEFPYSDFIALYRDVYKKHRDFALLEGVVDAKAFADYDAMDKFLLGGITALFKAMGYAAKISEFRFGNDAVDRRVMVKSQSFLADFFRDYADFMSRSTWYQFPYKENIARFKAMHEADSLSGARIDGNSDDAARAYKIERSLMRQTKLLFAAMQFAADLTTRFLSDETVDQTTQFLLEGNADDLRSLAEDERFVLTQLKGDLVLAKTPRYVPFTEAMQRLKGSNAQIVNVAGNKSISVIVNSNTEGLPKLQTPFESIFDYRYPTHMFGGSRQDYFHTIRIAVADLPKFLAEAPGAGLKVVRVHDF